MDHRTFLSVNDLLLVVFLGCKLEGTEPFGTEDIASPSLFFFNVLPKTVLVVEGFPFLLAPFCDLDRFELSEPSTSPSYIAVTLSGLKPND